MTLDETIKHAEEVAIDQDLCCSECAEEHRQLTKWLEDYKRLLEQQPGDDCVDRNHVIATISQHHFDKDKDNFDFLIHNLCKEIKSLPPVTPTFPKDTTNGDMIKAMFPKCCSNMGNFDNGIVVDFMGDLHSFDTDFWNAPYKRGDLDVSS